ncbi:MAG TPA: ATP-binding protein [Tepidisphaeraceae bacterium]|nr:ATP-binding protein [Tepidisphaeraceae bacterium]
MTNQQPTLTRREPILDWKGFALAALATAAATLAGWLLFHGPHLPSESRRPHFADSNVLMLYLLAVLWVATRSSRSAAILTSMLAVAAFDFCFVPPYLTFVVADSQYLWTFAVMLITALVISTLTHRARAEAKAARQAWERAEAEFLRNTLLSGVSHDLRTPLSAITGAASTLTEAGENLPASDRSAMLETISSEADRMERLINNLLEMTRLESGSVSFKKEWQPLAELVGTALHHLRKRLANRPIKIDLPPNLPLVNVDSVALEQVLVNLVDNAVEHTPPSTPIEITGAANNGQITLSVADHGPGLPKGAESRIFDKFFRAHSGQNRHGIGLGLAICRAIIDGHGGTITAQTRPAGGAIFHITLPQSGPPPKVDASA